MNQRDATIKAIENADYWMGGAVVIKDAGGDYDAIPAAHMGDASYTGSRTVVLDLSNGLQDSTGYSLSNGSKEEIADLLLSS